MKWKNASILLFMKPYLCKETSSILHDYIYIASRNKSKFCSIASSYYNKKLMSIRRIAKQLTRIRQKRQGNPKTN